MLLGKSLIFHIYVILSQGIYQIVSIQHMLVYFVRMKYPMQNHCSSIHVKNRMQTPCTVGYLCIYIYICFYDMLFSILGNSWQHWLSLRAPPRDTNRATGAAGAKMLVRLRYESPGSWKFFNSQSSFWLIPNMSICLYMYIHVICIHVMYVHIYICDIW